jgi:formylglycine-generating enzyme required for sulfatase activity
VVQVTSGSPVVSWSTFGEAVAEKAREGFKVVGVAGHCGGGAFAGASVSPPSGDGSAPLLILEVSATPRWDPRPMDPGPVPVTQIVLSMISRRLSGFSPDGKPQYGDPARELRSARLGEGEEFVLPILLQAAGGSELLDVREVLVRITAGQAGRPGATEYGALAVMAAAPGSEIVVDGGVACRAGADGSAMLPSVPVGLREIHLRSASGRSVVRFVTVVKARTVLVSLEAVKETPGAQPPFVPAGTNSQGFPEFRRTRDEVVMVRIPRGEFVMGNLETEGKPQPHQVSVSAFLMDKLPVTWGLFKRFAAATGTPLPPEPYWGIHDDHPVSFVRWDEAQAYCEWAGGRLPTEAEREKAARGTDGRKFPWGNEEPSPERGVFRRNWGYEGTDSVGIRPAGASPYGLLDTGGNVWEWCQDWYDPEYYKSSPREDPMGPRTGRARVVRGGSWDSRPTVLSASCRNWGYVGYREGDFGFRCAADLPR